MPHGEILMKLSRTSTYALYALGYLAGSNPSGYTPVSLISQEFGLPPTHLAKIFQRLVRAGILSSSRGVSGGFALRKAPQDLSLLDVIEAVDGSVQDEVCLLENGCDDDSPCPLHAVWRKGQQALIDELRGKTVAELGEELVMHARRRQRARRRQALA
ncbi:MAG: Rrf2 family transcriptional regulator [Planctomycetota bacterium]|nr:MAG: Rrf2 family transcriptional regulator [Planctomycetota bacterium]